MVVTKTFKVSREFFSSNLFGWLVAHNNIITRDFTLKDLVALLFRGSKYYLLQL